MKTGKELMAEVEQAKPGAGQIVFWWLGQASFIVKTEKRTIYLDPYLSESPHRLMPPPVKPEEVTNADIVAGSHDHLDHIDRSILPGIMENSPRAKLIVPKAPVDSLKENIDADRIVGLDAGEVFQEDDLKITAVKAAHEFLDHDEVFGYPYLGFVIETDGVTIYHSGDTCIYEGMAADLSQWQITLAFLPINGRDAKRLKANCIGNMTYQEAVDLAGTIRPKVTVPMHYGMFAGNTEDPALFTEYLRVKYPGLKWELPKFGEPVNLDFSEKNIN